MLETERQIIARLERAWKRANPATPPRPEQQLPPAPFITTEI